MTAASTPVAIDPATLPPYVLALKEQLGYLPSSQLERVLRAFQVGAQAHEGQTRKSGEPYITHPVAVAGILAELGMDAETIIAAILHDTLEDTALSRSALAGEFGETVAELVDGVTKLDKMRFSSRLEADAESFRKMLLAMARDLRVILIKLADRLHNMRTLGAKDAPSRRRIARETLEIYAPIAQRLGMNKIKAELQDLGFRALHPDRYRVISERIRAALGNRREAMGKIEAALSARLAAEHLPARVVGRIKSSWSIYSKMRHEHKSFAQLMDVYGFRVVVENAMNCYMALGVVHGLYKPVDRRFKDFIAIPKANGYQSLHTVLLGPFGAPIEVQIRSAEMDSVAERGVAAHWAYKTDSGPANSAQVRAREWLASLADSQVNTASSAEFIENVKIDLFPDEVYLFTPRGDILALPRNATALDFAYAVHTDVGDHAVAARVDKKLLPLRTRLESGQLVEIITAPSAVPNPAWLESVVTGKARTAIRQYLKHLQHEDAVDFGHRMLDRALDARGGSLEAIPPEVLDRFLHEARLKRLEELLAEIALGNRMPDVVARHLLALRDGQSDDAAPGASPVHEKIRITGAERGVLSFANCCHPLPGDAIIGYLSPGKGIVVHREECPNVVELRKSPERCVAIEWDHDVEGDYRAELRIEVINRPGVLATIAAAIAAADSNIENVEYAERDLAAATLLFAIEVKNRKHLAEVMRRVRRTGVVSGVYRYPL
ncbi:MAG: bifunctional GTP diphosphokinase/guanosine-3',5'-bis(diphosphate) 3'-diphosphatase [Rhodanobacter sp. 68-29]|uniref:RelA/SpoT family protein n=1 Tax=Rhodanobacter sp. PCA2 TaxID=2006117 RepID=UPI000868F15C|nr:bifunctional (p)ppGpp synthetase/guanosine-3',5'-bis(diphosphate) 3'-pyrophosphohydrolase [Rhodanobacter sp. PCA2]MBA2079552.1 bifunctional GTP diphosphokinase/guanosine-3',5'-bis(diphosphate) 3'-diphosphatase [Rhodanobacter sp. PCA2]MBN8923036.1 bifunctional (p)ppGpp synthetase/guanosine-3',5'-bis(diphosphate) 3'-pyrophosphohydrolase [Rhodanobacter sp.]ODU75345.1 MAG: bifunctional GTP diphosphokinase/guanosine-3',5'-bis(diphosphate) 3'-diphosphatase [Rhodanobacter sp. SCN 69-32]OJY58569.1 M